MTAPHDLNTDDLTPILFGHAAFQYLNAGCELELFRLLDRRGGLTRREIGAELGLQERATDILMLGTTALRLTTQDDGRYDNAPVIRSLFQDGMWDSFESVVAFEAQIVYMGQVDFVESLRHNVNAGLRRIPGVGRDLYHRFAENPEMARVFYRYMRSWSELANPCLADKVDFGSTSRLIDVGGGDAVNAITLAQQYPYLRITVLEIAAAAHIARESIEKAGLTDRITVHEIDFHHDEFPPGHDAVLLAHQLVIWKPEENIDLLAKAYRALETGGRAIIFNSMSNDAGDGPLMAALDSVYFAAIPAPGGMIYAWHQYETWLRAAGFVDSARIELDLWTPHGIIVATK